MTIDLTKPVEGFNHMKGSWESCEPVAEKRCVKTGDVLKYEVQFPSGAYHYIGPKEIRNTPTEPAENWWELPPERLNIENRQVIHLDQERGDGSVRLVSVSKISSNSMTHIIQKNYAGITILPPRKSLGWVNVYRDGTAFVHKSREKADEGGTDDYGSEKRIACVEIFEGDGL